MFIIVGIYLEPVHKADRKQNEINKCINVNKVFTSMPVDSILSRLWQAYLHKFATFFLTKSVLAVIIIIIIII